RAGLGRLPARPRIGGAPPRAGALHGGAGRRALLGRRALAVCRGGLDGQADPDRARLGARIGSARGPVAEGDRLVVHRRSHAVDSEAMARVLPAERDLRRVIGDGEGVPDGEVEGLSEDDLLQLHRDLVLLRTYDERSLVYHRQGRIGTYAIFWNHEAMQAGSVFALEREDWIFP